MPGWIASLVLGLPGLASGLLGYLNKRADAAVTTNGQNVTGDVTLGQAQLAAYVEERKVVAAERARLQESAWTRWMIPVAFGLCMIHFGAIVLDSTFLFGWRVAKLPPPYDAMEWSVVMAVIGVSGVSAAVRRIFK